MAAIFSYVQPPLDYSRLVISDKYVIKPRRLLWGMCYGDNKLFALELIYGGIAYALSAYRYGGQDALVPIDTITIDTPRLPVRGAWWPRLDPQEHLVYVPCEHYGISVIQLEGEKLVKVRQLRCVAMPVAVTVASPKCLYVVDGASDTIHLVDAKTDRIMTRLEIPEALSGFGPYRLAILGDTLLAGCPQSGTSIKKTGNLTNLLVYKCGSSNPGKLLNPEVLRHVEGISTDDHSKFHLADRFAHAVFVLNVRGELCHRIDVSDNLVPMDSAVDGGKLLVGCEDGTILVMSNP